MRHDALNQASRILLTILLVAVGGIALLMARTAGFGLPDASGLLPQAVVGAAWNDQVALISGHAGNDSGAVCEDAAGNVLLTEASINATVAEQTARRLRRAGADVTILDEYDDRLRGLEASVLVSIHADSCIDASGYKAAVHTYSQIPETSARLLACIDQAYPAATGLPHHPDTVTHNMTEYHAFKRIDPQTPAAIVELGFLGGDQALLVDHPERAAKGITDGILCFLEGESAARQAAEAAP
ncbi:MAG: N-acetylmuramoyl-L-alanine amidase [Caldilinea sp.]|nr:N-acetylmuramoyl-L-alanine amidase [Caldilineaceae bacterium]MCO5209768.1 N-acetylmuramoyl-L-alanine amidase [Caldilinea sp.]HRW45867.1 N-acetylmuramoyl-L-alanine amidase [Caldilinea sp.]